MVLLQSNDGQTVMEVDETTVLQSRMVRLALEESSPEHGIPLQNVNGAILSKIVEYMTKQTEFGAKKPPELREESPELQEELQEESPELMEEVEKAEEEVKEWKEVEVWEESYMDVSKDVLYDLYLAANYMDIEGLLTLCAAKVASLIRGKTAEEMREVFSIENDFTPEEEAEQKAKYCPLGFSLMD